MCVYLTHILCAHSFHLPHVIACRLEWYNLKHDEQLMEKYIVCCRLSGNLLTFIEFMITFYVSII